MDSQKTNVDKVGKIIDRYRIESILATNSNGVNLMRAINTTNNQHFIIKKVMIDQDNEKTASLSNLPQNKQLATLSGLLYNEVNNIKDMNIPRILKCLQLIKTKRSLYLVYQNYPELNLENYLKERGPVPALKIKFAKIICEILQEIHRKGYVYTNLTPASIYVISGSNLNPASYELRFVGFQFSKKINQTKNSIQVDTTFLQQSQFLAPEVLKHGFANFQSDIYSAGKIFQLLGLTQIKGKIDSKQTNQIIMAMTALEQKDRSPLSKVWSCLKTKQNETRLFDYPVLQLQNVNSIRKSFDTTSTISRENNSSKKTPVLKRNIQQQQRRLRKIIKIRTLVIYLNDLANFVLSEKNKTLFYLLLKKSIIVRANLMYEIKKMLALESGQHFTHLNTIKQVLTQQQNQTLNLLTKVQQNLKQQNYVIINSELQNRNQLNEELMEQQIFDFINKKKKQIKSFHSILDDKQRLKLIYLCSLSQKLVYGSFQKFFDEVVEDSQTQLTKQRYFSYLKTATTKQILDRLQKILKERK